MGLLEPELLFSDSDVPMQGREAGLLGRAFGREVTAALGGYPEPGESSYVPSSLADLGKVPDLSEPLLPRLTFGGLTLKQLHILGL